MDHILSLLEDDLFQHITFHAYHLFFILTKPPFEIKSRAELSLWILRNSSIPSQKHTFLCWVSKNKLLVFLA